MDTNPIAKKLQIKPSHRVLIVNAPEAYATFLEPLPREAKLFFSAKDTYDVIQLFVKNSEELRRDLKWLQEHLRSDTLLWITYPKKSSGIPSDLGMMQSWDETTKYGLEGVAAAAIDQTWTALRFRPSDQIKKSQSRNSEIAKNAFGDYIDVKKRSVLLPEDLKQRLENKPEALTYFNNLSYSHKKEYVVWVLSAKLEKTRLDRMQKMVEMLLNNKKNPAAK